MADGLEAKADKLFKIDFGDTGKQRSIETVLQLQKSGTGNSYINNYSAGSSVIINADRIILNAKSNHAFLCGMEGVTISSPKSIHIDSDDDVYIASQTEVYLGLPNRGRPVKSSGAGIDVPTTKASPTQDVDYEPVVLGLKLANLLEDLIVVLRDAVIRTPAGDGHMSVEMMYNLESLQARLPEMLSTAVFVDGRSHDSVDDAPTPPDTTLEVVNSEAGSAGSTTSGETQSTTGTTQQNTQSAINTTQTPLSTTSSGNNPDGPVQ